MGGITCTTSARSACTGVRTRGKAALFEALKSRLTAGEAAAIPYEELVNRLGRTATHLRVDVTRLRARYRAILREEVSGTVVDSSDVDEELRYLRQAMIA
jgi:hypothetical protein